MLTVARIAPAGFDARFSAVWRRYEYRVADACRSANPLVRGTTVVVSAPPRRRADGRRRRTARSGCTTSPPTASRARAPRPSATCRSSAGRATPTACSSRDVQADAFCHSMVRALVGACVAVGEGKLEADDAARLRERARAHQRVQGDAGPRAHPRRGRLPDDAALGERAEQTRPAASLTDVLWIPFAEFDPDDDAG